MVAAFANRTSPKESMLFENESWRFLSDLESSCAGLVDSNVSGMVFLIVKVRLTYFVLSNAKSSQHGGNTRLAYIPGG